MTSCVVSDSTYRRAPRQDINCRIIFALYILPYNVEPYRIDISRTTSCEPPSSFEPDRTMTTTTTPRKTDTRYSRFSMMLFSRINCVIAQSQRLSGAPRDAMLLRAFRNSCRLYDYILAQHDIGDTLYEEFCHQIGARQLSILSEVGRDLEDY